jgi:hypothetical protein
MNLSNSLAKADPGQKQIRLGGGGKEEEQWDVLVVSDFTLPAY